MQAYKNDIGVGQCWRHQGVSAFGAALVVRKLRIGHAAGGTKGKVEMQAHLRAAGGHKALLR